jgi:hypothetical protein
MLMLWPCPLGRPSAFTSCDCAANLYWPPCHPMAAHAGHNGCRDCLAGLQGRASLCPLCRAPFDPRLPLAPNTELRDLISLATFILMDERVSLS